QGKTLVSVDCRDEPQPKHLSAIRGLGGDEGYSLTEVLAARAGPRPCPGPAGLWSPVVRSPALLELAMNLDLRAQLQKLNVMAAKEIEVKIQVLLVCELEKKFSGKHVVFMAQTRILPKQTRKSCM
ncbi:hypothetical protein Celaphus_00014171, partial [Cervus elaphus hippelaphus]